MGRAFQCKAAPRLRMIALSGVIAAHSALFLYLLVASDRSIPNSARNVASERIEVQLMSDADLLSRLQVNVSSIPSGIEMPEPLALATPDLPIAPPVLHLAPVQRVTSSTPPPTRTAVPQAAAAASSSADASLANATDASCLPLAWLQSMSLAISRGLKYSRYSRDLDQRGTAYVRILVARSGKVLESTVRQGTGFRLLDIEAREVARRIGRFRPVPSDACPGAQIIVVDQPIGFGTRRVSASQATDWGPSPHRPCRIQWKSCA